MSRILVAFWSGTGNTEKMAELIGEGAEETGAQVDCINISGLGADEVLAYDVLAIGSPSMGQEVIEESEVEPFVEAISAGIEGRRLALFGSYGWGDGEWMRNWVERMRSRGAKLMDDGLIVQGAPEGDEAARCRDFGRRLAEY
jgi:flavodoxin short chain